MSKGWNIALWILQVLLGLAFISAGIMKTFQPVEALQAAGMGWVNDFPGFMVRFIGLSELAGGVGLILPAALRIKPVLTPIAGFALALVMVLAAAYHVVKGELQALPINLVLGGLAALIGWGRLKKAPIAARGG